MTIFRGPGGGGNATNDAAINILTGLSTAASNSATSSSASATAAGVSATNAATSASSSATSASGASTSATTATTQASAASTSASGASTSASNGSASAAAALASQNAAATSQATSSTAATTATTQASGASTSATNAASSATTASTQATNASSSASGASASATNASNSATAASGSASTASTQASNASSSASAASTSASNSATSATNASNSATAAANSAASINDSTLVHKTGNETIGGIKTFSSTIVGSVSGNAATVTTNANLTGAVTSVGNAASLGSFTSAQLAGALTDETGSGASVFATSPTLVTPGIKNASSVGVITLQAPVTATNRAITLPDATGTLLSTATPGVPIAGAAFSAYQSSAQSVSNATFVKLTINTKEFDTSTAFDATTNYRFTPTVSGYYQVSAAVAYSNTTQDILVTIFKNGSEFKRGNYSRGANACVSALVFFNGSTDYVESYTYQSSGGALNNVAGAASTYFQAAMVRSVT
jgi:hypothetical protein